MIQRRTEEQARKSGKRVSEKQERERRIYADSHSQAILRR